MPWSCRTWSCSFAAGELTPWIQSITACRQSPGGSGEPDLGTSRDGEDAFALLDRVDGVLFQQCVLDRFSGRDHDVAATVASVDRGRADECEYGGDDDLEADGVGQDPRGGRGLVAAVAQVVRLPGVVDLHHVLADPDARVAMVLGVDREHAGRADDEMVDVGSAAPHDRRKHGPAIPAQPAEASIDDALALAGPLA